LVAELARLHLFKALMAGPVEVVVVVVEVALALLVAMLAVMFAVMVVQVQHQALQALR
jgi:hypothetical protein